MCIYIFTTWLTFNPPPPPPLTAWRIRERNGASPVSKSEANGEKISIFYEGDNTPVPECSPFYCPGMKQRWRRCDFWGNVVLWFPSRNFILALQPLSSITASLLLAGLPTWSPQYTYISLTSSSRPRETNNRDRVNERGPNNIGFSKKIEKMEEGKLRKNKVERSIYFSMADREEPSAHRTSSELFHGLLDAKRLTRKPQ